MPISNAVCKMVVVSSSFYRDIGEKLLEGARAEYICWGGDLSNFREYWVHGTLEIPYALSRCLETGMYQVAVVLGCVIRGETDHYRYVSEQSIHHSVRVSMENKVPLGMGILTVDTKNQALQRAGGTHGNQGETSCRAALHLTTLQWK